MLSIEEIGPSRAMTAYRIIEQSWLTHYRTFMPLGALLGHAGGRLERYIKRLIRKPGTRAFLAIDGGRPIAAMTVKRRVDVVEVDDLFVLPGSTSRGAGTALLAKAKEIARERGVRLYLETMRDNDRARAFYVREGGKLVGFGHYVWGRGQYPSVFYRWPR